MTSSIDSIAIVHSYPRVPPDEDLIALGFSKKRGKKLGSFTWFNNGLRETHEPRISIYETWNKTFRLRVDLSIPNLLFGNNIQLPNENEINEALELVSNNVQQRTGLKFDAFEANTCRVDYAFNRIYKFDQPKAVMARYAHFNIPRLKRNSINYETVYFWNKSRTIKLYDKYAKECKKNLSLEVKEQARGVIRFEYGIINEISVQRFVKRLKFEDTTAKIICSQENIAIATNELKELLMLDSINFKNESKIKTAFQQIKNIKPAMYLVGFAEAINCFGENFYQQKEFKISESTYKRNLRECQKLGLL